MYKVNCPYCSGVVNLDSDDIQGYDEGDIFEKECHHCEKIIGCSYSVSLYFEAEELPCANGEEHNLIDIQGYPNEFFVGKKICTYCNEEFIVDKEANKKAIESYLKKIGSL